MADARLDGPCHVALGQGVNKLRITLRGKDPESKPNGSPTVYQTDRGSWLVQGWVVTDRDALVEMAIPEGETVVEIPDRMLQFFAERDQ
ncbi:hypothetical protein AB0I72_10815 [Nocardiopsis sp. NPDC049922]|uniref:hypothetical protein n=1 Tax=Nocardiopsis sp. NPDC049922 TaxID=3155157 RepID=UPI0033CEAA03